MAIYITADLHLSDLTSDLTAALRAFTEKLRSGDKLIIAGDLFDFFVGIDPADRTQKAVKEIAAQARQRGITLSFMPGNRDFLMRAKEAQYFGFELLPEYHRISAPYGEILVIHGDALCTNDLQYQKFKRRCRNPLLQRLFLMLPLTYRRRIGAKIRAHSSSAAPGRRDPLIYGPVPRTIEALLRHFNCTSKICGKLAGLRHTRRALPRAWNTHTL